MQFIFTTNGALTTPSSLPHFTTPPPHRHRLKTLKSRLPISRFPSQTLKIALKVRALCYLQMPISSNPSKPRKKGFFGYPFGSIEGKKGDEGSGEGRVLEGFRVGGGIGNNGVFDWCVLRPVVLVVICVVIGMVPVRGFQAPAAALPSITGFVWRKKKEKVETRVPNHEYSDYTKSLLDEVSGVLKMIDEVRGSKREVRDVENALKEVKWKREELQEEILSGMYRKLGKLYLERESLVSALDDASDQFSLAKSEEDALLDHLKFGRVEDKQEREMMESRVENLEATLDSLMTKSDQLSEKIADVEQQIERTELKALSIGVRELAFIEQECEHLVSNFVQDMRRKPSMRLEESSAARLSRDDIQKDLEAAQKEYLKQAILPSLVEFDDPGFPLEGVEPIRNIFAALFLASIGMLIDVHFLWNHVDILLAAVMMVIVVKTFAGCQSISIQHQNCIASWDVSGTNRGVCFCSSKPCIKSASGGGKSLSAASWNYSAQFVL